MKLIDFIKNNDNWEELLQKEPYCLKISRYMGFIMFKYDQINSDFSLDIVKECRGLILREDTLEIVCYPFDKFFNIDEEYASKIDWNTAKVQEKIDGSLIKVWHYGIGWWVSTNGSIQAYNTELPTDISPFKSFGDLFESVFDWEKYRDTLNKDYVYMFELVSPYNKVVVNYPEVDIYHIGTRDKKTLKEINVDIGIKKPKLFDLKTEENVREAAKSLPFNEEGYVVVDGNFNRVKVKSPAYVSAHRLVNNHVVTKEKVLELILMNEQSEFLSYFPEYNEIFTKIEKNFNKYKQNLEKLAISMQKSQEKLATRKEIALEIIKKYPLDKDFCFKIIDNKIKTVDDYINTLSYDKIIERINDYET